MVHRVTLYIDPPHHHVVPLARISLTFSLSLSCLSSLLSIASSRSLRLHSLPVQSCCRYVLAGRTKLARPYERSCKRASLMSSSWLLQQCPVCLVRLIWMVLQIGGRWAYSCCSVGCFFYDFLCNCRQVFSSIPLVSVYVVHPYCSRDTTAAGEKLHFILSDISDFHRTYNQLSLH